MFAWTQLYSMDSPLSSHILLPSLSLFSSSPSLYPLSQSHPLCPLIFSFISHPFSFLTLLPPPTSPSFPYPLSSPLPSAFVSSPLLPYRLWRLDMWTCWAAETKARWRLSAAMTLGRGAELQYEPNVTQWQKLLQGQTCAQGEGGGEQKQGEETVCVYVCVCVCVYLHVLLYVCMCVCFLVRLNVWVYVCWTDRRWKSWLIGIGIVRSQNRHETYNSDTDIQNPW